MGIICKVHFITMLLCGGRNVIVLGGFGPRGLLSGGAFVRGFWSGWAYVRGFMSYSRSERWVTVVVADQKLSRMRLIA